MSAQVGWLYGEGVALLVGDASDVEKVKREIAFWRTTCILVAGIYRDALILDDDKIKG